MTMNINNKIKVINKTIACNHNQYGPYYSIKYTTLDGKMHDGFGSYYLDFVASWFVENFEVVNEKENDIMDNEKDLLTNVHEEDCVNNTKKMTIFVVTPTLINELNKGMHSYKKDVYDAYDEIARIVRRYDPERNIEWIDPFGRESKFMYPDMHEVLSRILDTMDKATIVVPVTHNEDGELTSWCCRGDNNLKLYLILAEQLLVPVVCFDEFMNFDDMLNVIDKTTY